MRNRMRELYREITNRNITTVAIEDCESDTINFNVTTNHISNIFALKPSQILLLFSQTS